MEEELEKLINLTYGRFRDEFEKQITKEENDRIQQSAAKGISGPAFYSSITDLHLEKIRKLYRKRIEIEKQLMLDKYGFIPVSEVEGLKNRVNKIIKAGIKNLENKRYGGRIEPIVV